jgi:tetratricopeptide (TPR) repeat protein
MVLRAFGERRELLVGGEPNPTWGGAYPRADEINPPESSRTSTARSDVAPKPTPEHVVDADATERVDAIPVSADETVQQDALEAERAFVRASHHRKKRKLASDAVRHDVEERYELEGSWEALVDLYLRRIETALDTAEKVELLKRIADVYVHELEDDDQAFVALVAALDADPRDTEVVTELEAMARRTRGWEKLVDAVRAKVVVEDVPARELCMAEMLARWYRDELHDAEGARPFIDRVRRIQPSHPLVHRRLASEYREVGDWQAQRDALGRALVGARDDAERCAVHVTLAELYEQRAKDLGKSKDHFDAALALDPRFMPALRGLERIARLREDFTTLGRVLDAQIDGADSDEDRVGALLRLSELQERHFVKPQRAAPKLETVLDLDPKNSDALEGLERCYRAMRSWEELVRTLERRVEASKNVHEKTDCLMRIAEVHESKLGDVEAALEAYRRVYELDEGHRHAIGELARLSEKSRDWSGAAAYRSRLAHLTDDARGRAHIHAQIADMLRTEDRDLSAARLHYERAVELDPAHSSSWEGLRALAQRTGDPMNAVFCLERRAEHTDSPRLKAQLLVELAEMKAALGDTRGAFVTNDWALRTDPSSEAAARAVLDEYVRAERWTEAQQACELLLGAATREGDGARIFVLMRRATTIALALGNDERALLAALGAFDMRPDDLGAREGVVEACHRMRRDAEARKRAARALESAVAEAADLSTATLVRLADIRATDGQLDAAVEILCRVLARDATNERALTALGDLFVQKKDWQRACNCRLRLAVTTDDDEKRRALHLETATMWETQAKSPAKAALVLEEALAKKPGDLVVIHRLVALYGQLEAWDKLVDALRALSELETDVTRRARTLFALAGVVREKIGGSRRAAHVYDEVLDLDESRLDAFERIVRIYTELHEWVQLAIAYARMIGRVHDSPDLALKHALYHQLGLVYRDRLGDPARALEAFRCASNLAPENAESRKIVVELLLVMDQLDFAIETTRAAVRRNPLDIAPYRELFELYVRDGSHDKAWCALDALQHLGAASHEETRVLVERPPLDLPDVPGTLAPAAWASHVFHPELDKRLAAILRVVAPAVVRMRFAAVPETHRNAWLGRRVSAADSELAERATVLVQNAAEILGVETPAIYSRPAMPMPFAVAPAPEPAIFVSFQAFESTPSDLLPALVGRRIAELRPELLAHALFPTVTELKGLLKVAVRVAVSLGGASGSLKPEELALARALDPRELEALRSAVSQVLGGAERVEIRRWLELADASISRAGLLLAGDIDLAWRAMQREARAPGDLSATEWRREMLAFLVSDEHAELRGAIGVSLDG